MPLYRLGERPTVSSELAVSSKANDAKHCEVQVSSAVWYEETYSVAHDGLQHLLLQVNLQQVSIVIVSPRAECTCILHDACTSRYDHGRGRAGNVSVCSLS